jgi:hypothetical protein
VRLHGLLKSIVSNQDTIFVGHFCRNLWNNLGTSMSFRSIYHPKTNLYTEVVKKNLGNILRRLVSERPKQWDKVLAQG